VSGEKRHSRLSRREKGVTLFPIRCCKQKGMWMGLRTGGWGGGGVGGVGVGVRGG
jgi:hypothetical protein